jgi:hypothetical protein
MSCVPQEEVEIMAQDMPANMVNLKVDSPDPKLERQRAEQIARAPALAGAPPPGKFKVKCSVNATGQALGFLGVSQNNFVDLLSENDSNVAICEYVNYNGQNYLQIDSATVYRWLGIADNDYACWGLTTAGGWHNPVTPKDDGIYLANEKRTLYPYGNGWVCWGDTASNIKVEYIPVR